MELTKTAKPTSMRYLMEAAADLKEAQERLESNVRNARRCGNSWEEVGKALGISKQTAFNRYGKLSESTPPAATAATADTWTQTPNLDRKPAPETSIFSDAPAPATARKASKKLDAAAPAKTPTPLKKWTPESPQETYIDRRPAFWFAGGAFKNGVAQPGTGKGPHACPRCGSTNHKGSVDEIRAYLGECKPTKYDPQDIADYLNGITK